MFKRFTTPIVFTLAMTLCAGAALAQAKRDPDVQKTIERAYPGAQSQVMGNETINGVKVYNVNIANKQGSSTAQITEFGDFLLYGAPQKETDSTKQMLTGNVGQLFQNQPSDVQKFRSTSYLIDVPVQAKGKEEQTYQIRFDAVGRVLDILTPEEVRGAQKSAQRQQVKDDKVAKQLEQIARDRFVGKEAALQQITQSDVPGFYEVDLKGAAVTLNEQGQVLRLREDVEAKELPKPVLQAIDQLVKRSVRGQRVDEEYFQFTQQSPTGNAVVVKMRPDGDIIDVVNTQARQEEEAVVAKHKQQKGEAPAKKSD